MTANRRVISGVIQRMRTAPFPTTCPIQFPLKRLTIALHYEPTLISSRQLPYQRRNFGLKSGVGVPIQKENEAPFGLETRWEEMERRYPLPI